MTHASDARYARAMELITSEADRSHGLSLLRQVAETDHGDACLQMGMVYLDGNGVIADPFEAARWFERAGWLGVAGGYLMLGYLHTGFGNHPTARDKAEQFFGLAAAAGDADAAKQYARCLSRGGKDFEAFAWMLVAEDRGADVDPNDMHAVTARLDAARREQGRDYASLLEQLPSPTAARGAGAPPVASAVATLQQPARRQGGLGAAFVRRPSLFVFGGLFAAVLILALFRTSDPAASSTHNRFDRVVARRWWGACPAGYFPHRRDEGKCVVAAMAAPFQPRTWRGSCPDGYVDMPARPDRCQLTYRAARAAGEAVTDRAADIAQATALEAGDRADAAADEARRARVAQEDQLRELRSRTDELERQERKRRYEDPLLN